MIFLFNAFYALLDRIKRRKKTIKADDLRKQIFPRSANRFKIGQWGPPLLQHMTKEENLSLFGKVCKHKGCYFTFVINNAVCHAVHKKSFNLRGTAVFTFFASIIS